MASASGGLFVRLDRPFATLSATPTRDRLCRLHTSNQVFYPALDLHLQRFPSFLTVANSSHTATESGRLLPPRSPLQRRDLVYLVTDNPVPLDNPTHPCPCRSLACKTEPARCKSPAELLPAYNSTLRSTTPSPSPTPQLMLPDVSRRTSYHSVFIKAIRSIKWR